MTSEQARPRAFAVQFKYLKRWDVTFFNSVSWDWPPNQIVPLSKVICRKQISVSDVDDLVQVPIIGKISFGGVITLTKVDDRKSYKGRLFWANAGDLIYSKIRAKQGSLSLIPQELDAIAVSAEYPVYTIDTAVINSNYLSLVLRSSPFLRMLTDLSHGGGTKTRISPEVFERQEIPLPPLPIQEAIVAQWEAAQTDIKNARQQSLSIENTVEESAFTQAGISLHELRQRPKVTAVEWENFERWGVEFNRWNWHLSDLLVSNLFPMKRMAEVAEVNPTQMSKTKDVNLLISFVPMDAVSDKEGVIAAPLVRKFSEVSSGYTRFMENDVIWAKITPCMQNGKCAVAKGLENGIGFGSTEFHVIRSKDQDNLLPEYLWVLLRMKHIRTAAQRYFIGSAGQQRVPADFLEDLYIPVPPLEVQRKIVAQVQAQRTDIARLRTEAEQKAREIKDEVEALILGTKRIEEI